MTTPPPDGHYKHHPTPTKARVQGAIEFCKAQGLDYRAEDVFQKFNVPRSTGYRLLQKKTSRQRHNDPDPPETRGPKSIITSSQIKEIEHILETEGVNARALTWEQLGFEAGVEASGKTIKRALGSLNYHKCIACTKGWVSPQTAEHRVKYAKLMLERYPTKEDWKHVRFSDDVHFGWGPQGKLRIIRKPGQRYCVDCIRERDDPASSKDEKRFHCWAAVGYNFKSDIHFYSVPSNTNGKRSQKVSVRPRALVVLLRQCDQLTAPE
ncbi:MAG: hypothetical protein M1823_005142 [Watsoniomyces obsoletus]|nr:MAG: hypothetical protein M1823_005142 [Watsoniomyces obsoletus]